MNNKKSSTLQKAAGRLCVIAALAWSLPASGQVGIGIGTGGIGFGINLGSGRSRPAASTERELEYLKQELNLTQAQEAAVREAISDRNRYRNRSEKEANARRFEEDMKDILDASQHEKYLAIKNDKPDGRQNRKKKEHRENPDLPPSEWDDVYR
jgi:hypothetical protein